MTEPAEVIEVLKTLFTEVINDHRLHSSHCHNPIYTFSQSLSSIAIRTSGSERSVYFSQADFDNSGTLTHAELACVFQKVAMRRDRQLSITSLISLLGNGVPTKKNGRFTRNNEFLALSKG